MSDKDLAELNWELCISYLDDAIKALQEVQERLSKVLALVDYAKRVV